MRAYLTVWRLPSAPVLLLSGFAGRLPSAMVPLALLLMVQQQTGSYAVAGLASATLGIADRGDGARPRPAGRPPRPAVDPARPGGALPAAARRCWSPSSSTGAPVAALLAASALAGVATPLVSGTVRALWSRVDARVRPTAFALDATATELVFVAGPRWSPSCGVRLARARPGAWPASSP